MNKEDIWKEIEHIANCELYDTISIKYIKDNIEKIFEENKQLKDNWNKLRDWLKEYNDTNEKWYNSELTNHDREYYKKDYLDCKFWVNKFINEMQEIEKGDSNEL